MEVETNHCGTAWNVAASPNSAQQQNLLHSMTAVPGSSQLWAVGIAQSVTGSSPPMPLIERWNGTRWSLFNTPVLGQDGGLLAGVSAISATDAWSVGANALETLTEHFTQSRLLLNCPVG